MTASSARTTTAQAKFGGASGDLQGGSIEVGGALADFKLGTADFTIEAWVYRTSAAFGGIFSTGSASLTNGAYPSNGLVLRVSSANKLDAYFSGGADQLSTGVVPLNAWSHVALVRNAGVFTFFIDGVSSGSFTATYDITNTGSPAGPVIGREQTYAFPGFIDEVRVTAGLARYTAAFTAPTQPFCDRGSCPTTCATIKSTSPAAVSGMFTIDPDGTGGAAPFSAYCDMSTLGGGWTLVSSLAYDATSSSGAIDPTSNAYMDVARYGALRQLATMFRIHGKSTNKNWYLSKLEASTIANCNDLSSPAPQFVSAGGYRTIVHRETTDCTLTGLDYAQCALNSANVLFCYGGPSCNNVSLVHADSETGTTDIGCTQAYEERTEVYFR